MDWSVLEKLFNAAMDREPSERTAFLAEASPDDTGMRDEVLSLVLAYERATGKMENAVRHSARAAEEQQPAAGDRVGPYQLVRRLGFGGMGAVYLAIRADDQYRKEVAVKFLHFTLATPEMLQRFRGERQILASLEHPNIARLLDGGTTVSGLPYVVMEYVDGQPIDEYCARLSLQQKLELFRSVCAAVHYAHRSLVVHRDIKPGNILVTADGTPKLLDFGIAKLIGGDAERMTATAQRLLTPAYASPEQIRGEAITTSADVYSLGVLLYELLTGSLPYETHDLTPAQLERKVCEDAVEQASIRSGNRQLAGDLDNIVAMAIEKAPSLRYASADQFSDDIRRYLEGFPVIARRHTWRYSGAKFLERHKTGVVLVSALALLLVAFSAGMGILARRATREREKAEQVTRLLVNVFSVSNPSETRGNKLTAREILDKGAADVSRGLAGQPEIRSTLLETIAGVDQSLGLYTQARDLMEQVVATRRRILGPAAPETTRALVRLAELARLKRDYSTAEKLARESLELRRRAPGNHPAEIAESLDTLAFIVQQRGDLKTAESLFREALDMRRKLGGESLETSETLSKLGGLLQATGDWEGAERALRKTLTMRRKLLGEPHALVAISLDKLGQQRFYRRDLAEAETLLRQALTMRMQLFGEKNPEVGTNLQNLARVVQSKGDYEQAKQLYRRALAVERATLGDQDIETAIAMSGLASLLESQGDLEQAESLYRESLAMRTKLQGEENPSVARAMGTLGNLLVTRGKLDAAEPLLIRSLDVRRSKLGEKHFETGEALYFLARLNAARGRSREAERLYREALDLSRGKSSLFTPALTDLGFFLVDQKRAGEAEPFFREALDLRRRTGPGWQSASAESDLAACLIAEHKYSEARPLLERSLPELAQALGEHSREAEAARRRLVQLRGHA